MTRAGHLCLAMALVCAGTGCSRTGTSSAPGRERVTVNGGLSIDRYEVTAADFAACVAAGGCESGQHMAYDARTTRWCNYDRPEAGAHPMNCVTWDDAVGFCAWTGGRLPSAEEWEAAAEGVDGRAYPWGYRLEPFRANCDDVACGDGFQITAPVGSFPGGISPCGAHDMAGNVMEWTATPFNTGEEYESDGRRPEEGRHRVLKGGSWKHFEHYMLISSFSFHFTGTSLAESGFRCAYGGQVK